MELNMHRIFFIMILLMSIWNVSFTSQKMKTSPVAAQTVQQEKQDYEVWKKSAESVELLEQLKNPIDYAAKKAIEEGNKNKLQFLLEQGADATEAFGYCLTVPIRVEQGDIPVIAERYFDLAVLAFKYGVKIEAQNEEHQCFLIRFVWIYGRIKNKKELYAQFHQVLDELLSNQNLNLNHSYKKKVTLLEAAIYLNDALLIKKLICLNVNLKVANEFLNKSQNHIKVKEWLEKAAQKDFSFITDPQDVARIQCIVRNRANNLEALKKEKKALDDLKKIQAQQLAEEQARDRLFEMPEWLIKLQDDSLNELACRNEERSLEYVAAYEKKQSYESPAERSKPKTPEKVNRVSQPKNKAQSAGKRLRLTNLNAKFKAAMLQVQQGVEQAPTPELSLKAQQDVVRVSQSSSPMAQEVRQLQEFLQNIVRQPSKQPQKSASKKRKDTHISFSAPSAKRNRLDQGTTQTVENQLSLSLATSLLAAAKVQKKPLHDSDAGNV
jgi:hypothetical protein